MKQNVENNACLYGQYAHEAKKPGGEHKNIPEPKLSMHKHIYDDTYNWPALGMKIMEISYILIDNHD